MRQLFEHELSMHSPVKARACWNPGLPGTSMRTGLLTGDRNNYFFRLISPNLAAQPIFKFLLLTKTIKRKSEQFFKKICQIFFRNCQIRANFPISYSPNFSLTECDVLLSKYLFFFYFPNCEILKWGRTARFRGRQL